MSSLQQPFGTPASSMEAIQLHAVPRPHDEDVFYTGPVDPAEFYDRPLNALGMPDYDIEVEKRRQTNVRDLHPGIGRTWVEEWQMSDGSRNDVLIGKAANPLGMLVVKDCAWGTQVRGFNRDVALMLMRQGFDVAVKGPEKGASHELAENAHLTHKVLDQLQQLGIARTDTVALEGYSRGVMMGWGTIARAPLYGRQVLYANLTDGCLALKPTASPEQIVETLKGLPAEAVTAFGAILGIALTPGKLRHYRDTMDLSPKGAVQFIRTGLPLFTGEPGILAGQLPADTEATVAFFLNSFANDREEYKKIIKGNAGDLRPGVIFKYTAGGHGQALQKRILDNIGYRFSRLGTQLRAGARPDEINYSRIHRPSIEA